MTRRPDRPGNHAYRVRRAHALKHATTCYLCGRPIDKTLKRPDPMAPEADHVEPFAVTGRNDTEIRIVHGDCNRRKGALTAEQAGFKIKRTSGLWEEMIDDGSDC